MIGLAFFKLQPQEPATEQSAGQRKMNSPHRCVHGWIKFQLLLFKSCETSQNIKKAGSNPLPFGKYVLTGMAELAQKLTVSAVKIFSDEKEMARQKAYNLSSLNIVIVDDHQPMRRILRDVLREFGVRSVEEATDGQAALNVLNSFPADVIFTDYMMEPMTGMELIDEIRQGNTRVDRFCPIIVVSAYTEIREILMARDAGATEFLAKPFSANLVYYRLKAIVESPRTFVESKEFFGPDRRRREAESETTDRREKGYEYG